LTEPRESRTGDPRFVGAAVVSTIALVGLFATQMLVGEAADHDFTTAEVLRGLRACIGLDEPLAPRAQQIQVELRLWRTLTAMGVGACLAVAGALLQGVFRNPLASPSLIGVTAGASLGAWIAILALGGYAASLLGQTVRSPGPWIVTAAAFLGALAVAGLVLAIGSRLTRSSGVASLLLLGIAVNTCIAGVLASIQDILASRQDFATLTPMLGWSLGTLTDRKPYHVAMVAAGVAFAALVIPRVARELDLLANGDEDAALLGVPVARTRALSLIAAALATACAVAAAGQIGFLGLVIPHLLRMVLGADHRRLLWLCLLGGPVFLLATDTLQLLVLGSRKLNPGPLMSLVGGPMFLVLLTRHLRKVGA
jgi:iron complex transport system permease protein